MMYFLIETCVNESFQSFMVKAKTYSEACTRVAKLHGETEYKLLGMYEKSQVDANIWNRTK